jgi:broad specificity phosphatase PhoE
MTWVVQEASQKKQASKEEGMTRLILVRHGTSEANAQGRIDEDGSGSPLAKKGLQEAALVARRLAERGDMAAIYTRPQSDRP